MSTATHNPKVVNLCRALKKGAVPVEKLGADIRDDEVLGEAFAEGLIEVGRQQYTIVASNCPGDGSVGKPVRGKDGKLVVDEMKRPVIDREFAVLVEDGWSWFNRSQNNRAPLCDVLNEKVVHNVPPLHARLTSAGLAATA